MHRCRLFRILVLVALHQQLAPIVPVSAQEARRVRVAVTSPGMTNLSLYIADRRGLFKEQQIFNEIIVSVRRRGRFKLWLPVLSNSARRLLIR